MRSKQKYMPSSLKMKYSSLKRIDDSLDELALDLRIGNVNGDKITTDFTSWYDENIYHEDSHLSHDKIRDCDPNEPFFVYFATERNMARSAPISCHRHFQPTPPERHKKLGTSGKWLNKWKNRSPVKFSRGGKMECVNEAAKHMADDVREVVNLSTRAENAHTKRRFAQGIHTLLMALEYVERQEVISQHLFVSRLNNRMHLMEGDMEKAGEGAPDLAKLLEDQAVAKEVPQPHTNGIKSQETAIVEEEKKEKEVTPKPTPEVKEEMNEDVNEEETPSPEETTVEEHKQEPTLLVPKQEEEQQSSPPQPSTPEGSRKRALPETKEPEAEGSSGSDSDTSRKKNKVDQETETTPTESPSRESRTPLEDERERMISEFVMEVSNSPENLNEASDRLTKEIESLGELAAAKEMEWNAILRVRKLKEEMLERLLRRKRMNCLEEQPVPDRFPENLHNKHLPNNQAMLLRGGPRFPDGFGKQQRPILPKPSPFPMGMNHREGRNGPIVDVKSIIDDYSGGYRSRHPESAPRRGRRVRGTTEQRFTSANPSLISMANMALQTGASVRTISDHPFNIGFDTNPWNEMGMKLTISRFQGSETNRREEKESKEINILIGSEMNCWEEMESKEINILEDSSETFRREEMESKEITTLEGSKLNRWEDTETKENILEGSSESNRREESAMKKINILKGMDTNRRDETGMKETIKANGAKPYPEVTLHPVSPPSLLHQVLTKATPPRPASFSPTLARLLTAPERPVAPPPPFRPPSRVSIADILSSTKQKNRNEITITPVSGNPPVAVKNKEDVVLLDDDDGDGGDRLVIDEGSEEVPQCQGCRQKSAQFVCAGCGNQWYCSRDCQVSAWEEHSEVCTG